MSLKETITQDMKTAMKEKDAVRRDTLRVLMGEIGRAEQTSKGKIELTDVDVVKIVKKTYEGVKDTSYDETEMAILSEYIPKQMTETEIRGAVEAIVAETGAENMSAMGQVMGAFNGKYAGQADGKTVSTIVKELLG